MHCLRQPTLAHAFSRRRKRSLPGLAWQQPRPALSLPKRACRLPALYRLFGDKDSLLDAVAETALLAYVTDKASGELSSDPVEELRLGWDRHLAFAFAHPAIFAIMEAPRETPAMHRAREILRGKIRAVAVSGRLRMPEERALSLFHAAATGIIQVLLRQHSNKRDQRLSIEAREAALGAITMEATPHMASGSIGAAIALNSHLGDIDVLTAGERALLKELLDRIAGS